MKQKHARGVVLCLLCLLVISMAACMNRASSTIPSIGAQTPQETDAYPTRHVGPPQSVVIQTGSDDQSVRIGAPPDCANEVLTDWYMDTDLLAGFNSTQDYLPYHGHTYYDGDFLIYRHHIYRILDLAGAMAVPICVTQVK